jgi:uncharacterized membrane protein YdbT with pleckstrin-like domain
MPLETQNNPAIPQYQTLGKKVLWYFFASSLGVPVALFAAACLLLFLRFEITAYQGYVLQSSLVMFFLSAVSALIALFIAYLNYQNYQIMLSDDSLKIKKGIFSKLEIAIPFRQIQDVDIEQSVQFRMFGLSKLIILTAGHEDETEQGIDKDESEGLIPVVDQTLATQLQTELLKRADIQKVVQEPPTAQ